MGDAPAVVRVFWPHPSLPRISGVGGEDARSAGTGDDEPALVLVGWWRANTCRGAGGVVRSRRSRPGDAHPRVPRTAGGARLARPGSRAVCFRRKKSAEEEPEETNAKNPKP